MPWPPVRSPCIVPSVRTLRVSPVSHRYVPDKASEAARSDALRFPSRTPRRTRPPSRQSPDCLVTSSRGRGLLKSERKVSDLAKGASMMCFATSAFSRLSIRQPSPKVVSLLSGSQAAPIPTSQLQRVQPRERARLHDETAEVVACEERKGREDYCPASASRAKAPRRR